jgi:hypothetical protein
MGDPFAVTAVITAELHSIPGLIYLVLRGGGQHHHYRPEQHFSLGKQASKEQEMRMGIRPTLHRMAAWF